MVLYRGKVYYRACVFTRVSAKAARVRRRSLISLSFLSALLFLHLQRTSKYPEDDKIRKILLTLYDFEEAIWLLFTTFRKNLRFGGAERALMQ